MRILLVDDQAEVLQALMAIMKTLPGHTVRLAANSQKAHEHAAALGGVDLLVTDVVMEPTDGFTLRSELQAMFPEMQTVFVSGYDLSEHAAQFEGATMLPKPVDADALREAVAVSQERMEARAAAPVPVPRAAVPAIPVAQPVTVQARPVAVPQAVPQAVPAPTPATVVIAATPPAVAHAVPQTSRQPAVTQPQAAPVAVPQPAVRAVPQAAPVSQPKPQAVAAPPATVRAVPPPGAAPQPQAQAAALPAPTARAVPRANPVAQPVPPASAVSRATAHAAVPATGVPQPMAQPRPQPQATPTAAPTAFRPVTASPAAPASPVTPSAAAAVPVPTGSTDPLIGVQLGDYRVQQYLGEGEWGRLYSAIQLSVNRKVGLRVLDPERSHDEKNRSHFLADARGKAAVQHPFIVSVFEVDEQNGLFFYTHEFLDGATMEERIQHRQLLDEKAALLVMKTTGEGLQYIWSRGLAHGPLKASGLRLGGDNIARLENLAIAEMDPSVTVEGEIHTLGTIIQQLVQPNAISGGLRMLLERMTGGPNPITSWPVVLQAVRALEPKVIPVEAAKIRAADAAAMRAVEAARLAKKKAFYLSLCTLGALVFVLIFVIWKFLWSSARNLSAQVEIPAGTYTVGSLEAGGKATLGAYEIDKYEVTINEYAKFIAWCDKNPGREHDFDHPRGERRTSHLNSEVRTLIQNAALRGNRVFKQANDPGVEVDLNCPMVAVTFWDAYAYAQWRGKIFENGVPRDLPTEEEWEAAARGPRGFQYPWGNELKVKNFNSNLGYNPLLPGSTKTADGYNFWAPVDEFSGDESAFKVHGMAGNVSEWVYRKESSREIPLLKGASFASDPMPMWGRILQIPAEDAWFVFPAANKPKGSAPVIPGTERYYVKDDVTPSFRALYVGFRTVKRK